MNPTLEEARSRRSEAHDAVIEARRVLAEAEAELTEALYAEVAALSQSKRSYRKKEAT